MRSGEPIDAVFWLKLATVIGMLVAMLYGAKGVFIGMKEKQQGFGHSSVQALAITFFLPSVVLVAIVTDLDSQALAALFGTVAGYVLSSPKKGE